MRYFPFERFTISSELSVDTLAEQLASLVDTPMGFRVPWDESSKPLEGLVDAGGFCVWPLTKGWLNGFRLEVVGSIQSMGSGSAIHAVSRYGIVATVIWVLWVTAALAGVAFIAALAAQGEPLDPGLWVVCLLPIVGYGLPIAAFNWGTHRVKHALSSAALRG